MGLQLTLGTLCRSRIALPSSVRIMFRINFGLLLLVVTASTSAAQQPGIPEGRLVRIFADSIVQSPLTGHIQSSSLADLVLRQVNAPTLTIPRQRIQRLDLAVPNPTRGRRSRIGALIGAGLGVSALYYWAANRPGCSEDCREYDKTELTAIIAGFTVSGAMIGASAAYYSTPPRWQTLWSR